MGGIKYFFTNASFKFTVWLRLGQYLRTKKSLISKFLYFLVFVIHKHNQYLTGIQVGIETRIKGGLRFQHFSCIIINKICLIGENVLIFQGVTIGASVSGVPVIGNNVVLCAGCKIVGNVHIGNNVMIGANAVVTHDVHDNSIAVGVPAQVIITNKNKVEKERKAFLYQ